jgi:acetyltransferase-like isoleucine patch superfamily enzyme
MEDFSSRAPNVSTSGNCRFGRYSAISIGATLIHGVKIGKHTVVGTGSTVLKDVEPYCISYGNPSLKIKQRNQGDKYL